MAAARPEAADEVRADGAGGREGKWGLSSSLSGSPWDGGQRSQQSSLSRGWRPFWPGPGSPESPTPCRLTSHRPQPTGSPGAGGRAGTTPPASRPPACEVSPAGPGPKPPGAREAPSTNSAAQALRDLRRRSLPRGPGAVQAGLGRCWSALSQSLQIRDLVFHGRRDLLEPIAQLHLLRRAVLLQGSDDLKCRDQLDSGRQPPQLLQQVRAGA